MTESSKEKTGVSALIISGGYFLTIEECHLSRLTQKIPGMRSMVYETVEPGESDQQALVRALTVEELKLGEFTNGQSLVDQPLCKVQLNSGIWLSAYLLPVEIPRDYPLKIGTAQGEVTNPGWNKISVATTVPKGSERFRPGNREVLTSYLSNKYKDNFIIYNDIEDRIPESRFDYLEANQKEA